MKKSKIVRVVLAVMLILALTFSLAACKKTEEPAPAPAGQPADAPPAGNQPAEAPPAANNKYTLAFNNWGSGAEVFDWHEDEIVYIVQDLLGMSINCASDENTADGILRNVQNFVASGVDGILMTCNQAPVLPQISEAAKSASIPFNLSIWVGTDDQRVDLVANNPFFTGSFLADTYAEAYVLGKIASADGNRTACMIGGNLGDPAIDTRVAGFTQAFVTEGGGQILDIARCSGPPEAQEKASAMLSANRDADCLYAMVGDFFPGAYNAMTALGISPDDMTVYCSLCSTETSNYILDGIIKEASGGHDLSCHLAACALINYLDGHPILDENGEPPQLIVTPFIVNKDNAEPYMDIFFRMTDGQHVLPDDYLKSLLWRFNPDVTYRDFTNFCDNLSLEYLLGLHGK